METKLDTLKAVALAVGIVIVLNAFFNIGIRTFYPAPAFDDFCGEETRQRYETQEACEAVGGEWLEAGQTVDGRAVAPVPLKDAEPYCDTAATCRQDYGDARERYDRNVFVILVIAGLVALGVGLSISAAPAVSAGFVYGGVVSFIVGTLRYWSQMDDYLRFIVLAIVLAILVWLGYRKTRSGSGSNNSNI